MDHKTIRRCHAHNGKRHKIAWGVNRFFNIPLASLFNYLDGKTKFGKVGLYGVFTKEKESYFCQFDYWNVGCGLSITVQQLKPKVANLA
jgi:hypothetical protein